MKLERKNKRTCKYCKANASLAYELIFTRNIFFRCGASLEEVQEEAKNALQAWDKARKSIEELEAFVKVAYQAIISNSPDGS